MTRLAVVDGGDLHGGHRPRRREQGAQVPALGVVATPSSGTSPRTSVRYSRMPFWVSGIQARAAASSARLAIRFPNRRSAGIERRSRRSPITASAQPLASTMAGMRCGSCCPSESSTTIASGGRASASSAPTPSATALPFPPFSWRRSTRTRLSPASSSSERAIAAGAPSSTSTTSSTCFRLARATSTARSEANTGITAATVATGARSASAAPARCGAGRAPAARPHPA